MVKAIETTNSGIVALPNAAAAATGTAIKQPVSKYEILSTRQINFFISNLPFKVVQPPDRHQSNSESGLFVLRQILI